MCRSQVLRHFFFKSVVPIAAAFLLYIIFRSACTKGRQVNYLWLWILCRLPFSIHRMFFWISLGGSIASFISKGLAVPVLGSVIASSCWYGV